MTVPTFFFEDKGLGDTNKAVTPYIAVTNKINPLINESAVGSGPVVPTSGQTYPRGQE